jgi:hypothetical protein
MPLCSQVAKAKKITKRKQTLKFTIDCSQPVDDGIMDAMSFSVVRWEEGALDDCPDSSSN